MKTKKLLVTLLKGIAAALAGFAGLIIGGLVATLVGLPPVGVPEFLDTTKVMPLMILSAIPACILLGESFRRVPLRYGPRALASAACFYVLFYAANLLDGLLFNPLPNMSTAFFSNVFPSLATGFVVAAMWKPAALPPRPERPDWLFARIAIASLAYVPIYYVMGLLVAPFTRGYYEDPAHQLGLVLPPLSAILLMQVPRGALFLLAVLPLQLGWRGSRISLWLCTGSLIFSHVAASVLFQSYWLPAAVRVPHSLELLVDSFLQAGLYALLLGPVVQRPGHSTHTPLPA
jgi:hypothetical protein